MLERISIKLMNCFEKQMALSESDKLKMILGFEGILHQVMLLGSVFMVAYWLQTIEEVLIFLFVFVSYRKVAGGFHLKTSSGCIIVTTFIVIIGSKLALYVAFGIKVTCVLFFVSIFLAWHYAPRRTENYPLERKEYEKEKKKVNIIVSVWMIVALLMAHPIRELITVAILAETVTLVPNQHKRY